jgi:hypothetical protein
MTTSDDANMPLQPRGTIDVRVREVRQLFNSLDATPFPETDLDADAEEFILGWAMEFPSDAPLRIRMHVEQLPSDAQIVKQVEEAFRSFFAYRADVVRRQFRRLMARGRLSLVIGLSCLTTSVAGANLLARFGEGTVLAILRESLLIGGWVAMWGPLEILLYDWWPLRQERRVCERLAEATVEIVPSSPRSHAGEIRDR